MNRHTDGENRKWRCKERNMNIYRERIRKMKIYVQRKQYEQPDR